MTSFLLAAAVLGSTQTTQVQDFDGLILEAPASMVKSQKDATTTWQSGGGAAGQRQNLVVMCTDTSQLTVPVLEPDFLKKHDAHVRTEQQNAGQFFTTKQLPLGKSTLQIITGSMITMSSANQPLGVFRVSAALLFGTKMYELNWICIDSKDYINAFRFVRSLKVSASDGTKIGLETLPGNEGNYTLLGSPFAVYGNQPFFVDVSATTSSNDEGHFRASHLAADIEWEYDLKLRKKTAPDWPEKDYAKSAVLDDLKLSAEELSGSVKDGLYDGMWKLSDPSLSEDNSITVRIWVRKSGKWVGALLAYGEEDKLKALPADRLQLLK